MTVRLPCRMAGGLAGLAAGALLVTSCGWDRLDAIGPAPGGGDSPTGDALVEASTGGDAAALPPDGSSSQDGQTQDATGDGTPDGDAAGEASPPDDGASSLACSAAGSPVRQWTFDSDLQGWTLSMDTGVVGNVSWMGSSGNPSPGALAVEITSVTADGGVANGSWAEYEGTSLGNLSGRTLSAWLWLDSGVSPHLKVFVQTGSQYTWADNGTVELAPGAWTCVSMAVSSPSYTNGPNYDPTNVVRVGFEMLGASPFRVFVDTVRY
jgi:hypothetical protein